MIKKLSDKVGNTSLVSLPYDQMTVWGKAEFMNPGGSVKDRMATYILTDAEKRGVITLVIPYVKLHQEIVG